LKAFSYVSPRKRAQRTLELLYLGCRTKFPWQEQREHEDKDVRTEANVEVYEGIREWDYGDYEGLTSQTIREQRKAKGEGEWDIWRDGCPGGEYVPSFPPYARILKKAVANVPNLDPRSRLQRDVTSSSKRFEKDFIPRRLESHGKMHHPEMF